MNPRTQGILIFDDIITTGAGFKAVQEIFLKYFSNDL